MRVGMAPMPDYMRITLNSGIAGVNPELAAFYAFANKTIPEVAITEFAARVCYNSTGKMGTAPNFVRNVLEHGHLSVAEHASVAARNRPLRKIRMERHNRFFTISGHYVCGNMRSWIEFLSKVEYKPFFEPFLAIFPPAFNNDAVKTELDPAAISVMMPLNVPSMGNVNLLAVNFGNMENFSTGFNIAEPWGRFTFLIEGISRAASHQIARHRGASISEQSLRYVDAGKVAEFTYPPSITEEQSHALYDSYQKSFQTYLSLREQGMKKEDARFALPLAMQTRMVISFDRKELMHFLNVRCAKDAQWEVRGVAEKMAMLAMLASERKEFEEIVERYKIGRTNEG